MTLSGSGNYEGTAGPMQWVGGSLSGDIGGQISANAGLPPPIASVASVSVWGGANSCITMQVAPDVQLTQLGGQLEVGASASFLGMSTESTKDWPFGDECGGARSVVAGIPQSAWVPHDGQLAMAITEVDGQTRGIAVWSEISSEGPRPLGEIHYRLFQAGTWSAIQTLTNDGKANFAPVVEFDAAGNALLVYQRSVAAPATTPSALAAFADSVDLHWARLDGGNGTVLDQGVLTDAAGLDFGAQLRVDQAGQLWVFWQRAQGVAVTGTSASPAQLWASHWQGTSWSATSLVTDGLVGVWGWSAAVRDAETQWLVISHDEDQDFATDADRNLSLIRKIDGAWGQSEALTLDAIRDDSPHLVVDSSGDPVLLWRAGDSVVELHGDLSAMPQAAFSSPDPLLDEGVDAEFAHARVMAGTLGTQVHWNQAGRVVQTHKAESGAVWTSPSLALDSTLAQRVLASREVAGQLVFGYATQAIGPGRARDTHITPMFSLSVGAILFGDGFE
ncbi:MAG TPA: hypothetical protein PK027_03865 [Aquimonas sp.]|nr:hypothetical protein [Aquimonas sp.]